MSECHLTRGKKPPLQMAELKAFVREYIHQDPAQLTAEQKREVHNRISRLYRLTHLHTLSCASGHGLDPPNGPPGEERGRG